MTVYYGEVEVSGALGSAHRVRVFWDKTTGHGVDVIYFGAKNIEQTEVHQLGDRSEALTRFATVVKRITREVYG